MNLTLIRNGAGVPWVLLPGADATLFRFRFLQTIAPLWGCQYPGLTYPYEGLESVEAIASECLTQIKSAGLEKFRLVGFCFGALPALKLAHQIGSELILIDPGTIGKGSRAYYEKERPFPFGNVFKAHAKASVNYVPSFVVESALLIVSSGYSIKAWRSLVKNLNVQVSQKLSHNDFTSEKGLEWIAEILNNYAPNNR